MHIADEPVTEHLSAAQDAVVSNRLQVVAIIVALAALIAAIAALQRRNKDD